MNEREEPSRSDVDTATPPNEPSEKVDHEFQSSENVVVGKASSATMILAMVTLLAAVVAGVQRSWAMVALDVITGGLLLTTSSAFGKIVTTKGNDVRLLMSALQSFATVLFIRIVLLALAVIAAVVLAFYTVSKMH